MVLAAQSEMCDVLNAVCQGRSCVETTSCIPTLPVKEQQSHALTTLQKMLRLSLISSSPDGDAYLAVVSVAVGIAVGVYSLILHYALSHTTVLTLENVASTNFGADRILGTYFNSYMLRHMCNIMNVNGKLHQLRTSSKRSHSSSVSPLVHAALC